MLNMEVMAGSRIKDKGYSYAQVLIMTRHSHLWYNSLQYALLSFAVQNEMQIHQMYVVTAFLYDELNKEIYMQLYLMAGL